MTALPGIDITKVDREIQEALRTTGPFDPSYFPPVVLRAALLIAREWRQLLNAESVSTNSDPS
jgi:hypothetical protein